MENLPSTADYWVGPAIGQGSFSQVYFAKHKHSNRHVAIKVVDQVTVRKNPKILKALLQEQMLLSTTLRQLECVARLGSSFYDSNCLYMILELCEGGDLQQLIEKNQTRDQQQQWLASIPHYLSQLQKAIECLHSFDVVHCDIKPANVLVTSEGRVKLTDFGSALVVSKGVSRLEESIRGTTEYSAPELLRNENVSLPKAIDYWSFGCVVIAMSTGQSPFYRNGSDSLTVKAILESRNDTTFLNQLMGAKGLLSRGKDDTECTVENSLIHSARGLLKADPAERSEAWKLLQSATWVSLTAGSVDLPPYGISPPDASWKKEIDNCELQDGALGWKVFLL